MIRGIRSLPRTVWLVSLISLVNDAASDMIYPLVPLYLASVLMAGPKALGLIEGIAEAVSSVLKLFAGALADRSGKVRAWVIAGYGIAGFARPLIGVVTSWPGLLACRFAVAGLDIREVPSVERPRIHGETNLRTFADGFRVLRTLAAERRRARTAPPVRPRNRAGSRSAAVS